MRGLHGIRLLRLDDAARFYFVYQCVYFSVTSKDLVKRLVQDGWLWVGGKGDHEKFKQPTRPDHVVVPHPRKDMPLGTLRNIYRQAGWPWKE